jgi:hypothetical protein
MTSFESAAESCLEAARCYREAATATDEKARDYWLAKAHVDVKAAQEAERFRVEALEAAKVYGRLTLKEGIMHVLPKTMQDAVPVRLIQVALIGIKAKDYDAAQVRKALHELEASGLVLARMRRGQRVETCYWLRGPPSVSNGDSSNPVACDSSFFQSKSEKPL